MAHINLMTFIHSIALSNFRSYAALSLTDIKNGAIVLTGENGAGKTNLLEAVSLFSPGRGLRGVKAIEMQKAGAETAGWGVSASFETSYVTIQLGTGLDMQSGRRIVQVNGAPARSQTQMAEYVSCIWLTPQMDGLFIGGSSERRRFFDRLIYAFDPAHAGRLGRYENALLQRSRLLKEGNSSAVWLDGLEATLAETGLAIAIARHDFAQKLEKACIKLEQDVPYFPTSRLHVTGFIEDRLERTPSLELEGKFREALKHSRVQDAAAGGAKEGPHRSDWEVVHAPKNMPASQCSTGEQKILLTGIILAHARLIALEREAPPILLLDEIAAHLDAARRVALFDVLDSLGGQVWMTGTDEGLFEAIQEKAVFYRVKNGQVVLGSSA